MITDATIARWRLRTQHLVAPHLGPAEAVVRHLLAMQGEQPVPTSWAVGCRTASPDSANIAALLERGDVIRTHVLRPTWHYVAADDLGWLVELTGPRVQRVTGAQLRIAHGLEGRALDAAAATVVEVVDTLGTPTRPELAGALAGRGLTLGGQALMLLLCHVELAGAICGGPPVDGAHTYALLSARAPAMRRLDRDAALAELALRYATGHGSVTEGDLAYWATLPLGDVRRGFAAVRDRLECFEHDGRTFWHAPGESPPARRGAPGAHLLSLFDEIYRGYQETRWTLDAAGLLTRGREPSTSIALADGQVVARVRRTATPTMLRFELTPYRPLTAVEVRALDRAASAQGEFFGCTAELSVIAS